MNFTKTEVEVIQELGLKEEEVKKIEVAYYDHYNKYDDLYKNSVIKIHLSKDNAFTYLFQGWTWRSDFTDTIRISSNCYANLGTEDTDIAFLQEEDDPLKATAQRLFEQDSNWVEGVVREILLESEYNIHFSRRDITKEEINRVIAELEEIRNAL